MKNLTLSRWLWCTRLIFLALVAAAAAVPALADYNVTISTAPSANGFWSGGSPNVWTPSGTGSNVNVSDIQGWLNSGTGVTVSTAGGGAESGDILVQNALSWSASALTLTAANNVRINAVMTASGTSALAMTTGGSGTVKCGFAPGELNGFAGRVDFPGRSGTGFLTINGAGYTVITSLGAEGSTTGTDLQGISGALAGKYALGANIDATATLTWNWDSGSSSYLGFLPLGDYTTKFTGVFDGLGHTIASLTIDRPSGPLGLFGQASAAPLRNVGLANASVLSSPGAGALAGYCSACAISNAYVDNGSGSRDIRGAINGSVSRVGGLVGYAQGAGTIRDVYARISVSTDFGGIYYYVGGLVGVNYGTITGAYYIGGSGGPISGPYAGGLVGLNYGTITGVYVSNVTILNNSPCYGIGGLVGQNFGTISNACVSNGSYLAAANFGDDVGGLVGDNAGAVINAYAVGGTVHLWSDNDNPGNVGGLVGLNETVGTITNAYAAGGPVELFNGGNAGGLVGSNSGTVTNSFWNTQTTGQAHSSGSADSFGLTTAQMKLLAMFTTPNITPSWDIDDASGTGKVWRIYDTHSYPLLRYFLSPLAVTANDDTRVYTGTPYSGGNGVTYSPAGYDASKVFGTVAYGGSSQGAIDVGAYAITPGGLWSSQPGYDIGNISGTLTILAAAVGRVPDGAPGTPLSVTRNLSQLNLTWGASCGAAANDYAVYEGTIGSWYSHSSLVCSTSNATSATVTPNSGDRYYLIVPLSASKEGSYGTRTGGTEIPQGPSPCKVSQDLSACQ